MEKQRRFGKIIALFGILFSAALSSCASSSLLTPTNDIVTFSAPQSGKDVVRVGFSMNMNWKPLIAALEEQFPTKQFIYDFNVTSGIDVPMSTIGDIVKKNDYDLVFANYWNAPLLGADISNESFLDNYLQTTLDSIASDGHIYGIPLPTSAAGIYYNKELFAQQGWELPKSTEDFVTLCHTIQAAGYNPFDCCLKYEASLIRMLQGMVQDELFSSADDMAWYGKLIAGKSSFAEHATPMFTLAKRLFDEKILTTSQFTASLTTMRQNFFAGKSAMIDYTSDLFSLAASEDCPFDVGIAPYPSTTGKNSPVLYFSSAILYIPQAIKSNSKRFAFDTSVMEYLSTSKGQDALLTGWSGVPGLKKYDGISSFYQEVSDFIQKGNYHSLLDFAPEQALIKPLKSLVKTAVQSISGGTAIAEAVKTLDDAYLKTLKEGVVVPTYNKVAEASADFSILETSYYLADKIKAATGADFALVPNDGFYRSNMAFIHKGDITDDTRLFYQKGLGTKDVITTYSVSGKSLLTALEHPIINGTELDQYIAASGSAIEYAPWHKSGNRILKATFEDGSAIEESKNYVVACYAGALDKSYQSETLQSFAALGDPQTFILACFQADKVISPSISKRVKLVWDIEK